MPLAKAGLAVVMSRMGGKWLPILMWTLLALLVVGIIVVGVVTRTGTIAGFNY